MRRIVGLRCEECWLNTDLSDRGVLYGDFGSFPVRLKASNDSLNLAPVVSMRFEEGVFKVSFKRSTASCSPPASNFSVKGVHSASPTYPSIPIVLLVAARLTSCLNTTGCSPCLISTAYIAKKA